MTERYRPAIDPSNHNHSYGPSETALDTHASWLRQVEARRAAAEAAAGGAPKPPTNLDKLIAAHRGVRRVPIW